MCIKILNLMQKKTELIGVIKIVYIYIFKKFFKLFEQVCPSIENLLTIFKIIHVVFLSCIKYISPD